VFVLPAWRDWKEIPIPRWLDDPRSVLLPKRTFDLLLLLFVVEPTDPRIVPWTCDDP
jgi:hypothetical protein